MTPYEKAKSLQREIEDAAGMEGVRMPKQRYAVLGEPVIECESLIIALTGMVIPEGFDLTCGAPQLGTFSITLARDCANTATQNGTTDIVETEKVAKEQAMDAEFLWIFASRYHEFLSKTWSMGFSVTGGISITSLLLTTGID